MPGSQELLKPPLHVLLAHDRDLPRRIQLSPKEAKVHKALSQLQRLLILHGRSLRGQI
jgi:hypothetical protein